MLTIFFSEKCMASLLFPINFDAGYVPNILDVKLLDEVVKVRRRQPVNILLINGPYRISNLEKIFFFHSFIS